MPAGNALLSIGKSAFSEHTLARFVKKKFEAGPLRKSMRNSSDRKLVSSSGMKHETKHSRVNRVTADWSQQIPKCLQGHPKLEKQIRHFNQ